MSSWKMLNWVFWLVLCTLVFCQPLCGTTDLRFITLTDFESGSVDLLSWLDEDVNPGAWQLTTSGTYQSSAYSLLLTGNTWKQQMINPVAVDSGTVFQAAAKTSYGAKIQGIGFSDGTHALFYSLSGSLVLNLEQWIPVYQGAFTNDTWNTYQFPIADDWYSFFDYLPVITSLIYINDLDGVSNRNFYLDSILNVTSDLGVPPTVNASCQITIDSFLNGLTRNVGVQFQSSVADPDSGTFVYLWEFGDGLTSTEANPYHVYTVTDNHPYRATLKVTDDTGKWGLASCLVNVDPGLDTLPLRMNFVGDIMLARRYESGGGIIPTQGVNAIFAPTLDLLGNAADITVANLEVVLTNQGSAHPTKSVVYRGNPANASGLVYAGIDKVSIANNHVIDYGLAGLNQMRGVLDQNGIVYSGSGADSYTAYTPTFINRSGLNIAFLASSDRTGQYNNAQPFLQAGYDKPGFAYMTPYYMLQQLAAVENVADLKIMELHGGSEYSLTPGSGYDKNDDFNPFLGDDQDEDYNLKTDIPHLWDIDIRHFAIDAGADLVIVHHPHIIQAVEVYQGKVIMHSLGNFVFDLDYPETMPTIIFYADADHTGFSNYLIKPVYIDAYIPKPAIGQLGTYILDYLAMCSRQLGTKLLVDYNNLSASILLDDDDAFMTEHSYVFNQIPQPVTGQGNLTEPFKTPRYGSISSIDYVEPVGDAQVRLGTEVIWYGNFEDEGSTLWDVATFSTDVFYDGTRSAMIAPANGQTNTATIKQRCKLYDNTKKYTLHGWIKTNNATNVNIIMRYYNTRTGYQLGTENITSNISGTNDWAWFYKELNIPANAWYYDIRLTCTNSGGGVVQAFFDNVGLIEWTPWSDIASLSDIPTPNNYYWMQAATQETPKSINVHLTEQRYSPSIRRDKHVPQAPAAIRSYPNPFTDSATLEFEASGKGRTRLGIYNLRGQEIRTLAAGNLPEGKHSFTWDGKTNAGRKASSGIYLIRLEQNGSISTCKVVLIH